MLDQASSSGVVGLDGARVLAVALESAGFAAGEGLDPATAAARNRLRDWLVRTGAPVSELRRAARRLTAVAGRIELARAAAALGEGEPRAAARALVSECGRWDRDFVWDVPLRDVARALVEAAAWAVRETA